MDLPRNSLGKIDYSLIVAALTLIVIGILFIYSSGITSTGANISNEYIRQIIWALLGLILLFTFAIIKYERIRDLSVYVYAFFLILIIVTLFTGRVVNGAKSWLGVGELGIQPSEFLKLATIIFLSKVVEQWGKRIRSLQYFLLAALIVILPMGLILLQPDFGTALVFVPIFLIIMFFGGAKIRHVVFLLLLTLLTVLFILLPAWDEFLFEGAIPIFSVFSNRDLILSVGGGLALICIASFIGYRVFKKGYFYAFMYFFSILCLSFSASILARVVIKGYQLQRLIVFLDPYYDSRGAGWNIIQSITAVGAGGINGRGFLEGTQSHLRFLPEQSTDFIFSILSEEWGFIGGLLVFAGFLTILYRGIIIAMKAKDPFGSLIAAGIVGMIAFHLFINVGMAIGIMPITGIPLFFMSYGGSSLWTVMMSIGLLISVHANRYQF